MTRTILLLTGATLMGLGAWLSPVLSYQANDNVSAHGMPKKTLTASEHTESLELLFDRADFDQDNRLDVDEYTTLQVVKAELARLNGFVTVENDNDVDRVYLAQDKSDTVFAGLSRAERVRIDAVARLAFYTHVGGDQYLSLSEFIRSGKDDFAAADKNSNGRLVGKELVKFAVSQAGIANSNV